MKTRTLLIDADIVLYKVASMVEVATDWGDGIWTLHSDLKEAIPSLNKCVESYLEKLDTDIAKMCLTGHNNFRKKVHSEYKANRLNKRKPLVLGALREYVEATYDCLCEDNLEADDLMGLYSQHVIPNNENIIVSIDKDMRTIPCKLCVAIQCLTGDSTDNYHGCPGVGPVKAKAILDKAEGSYWEAIVAAYKKAELTEKQALQQARLAYILHDAKDYNFKTKKVKQWTP